jgi:hypothetical protein
VLSTENVAFYECKTTYGQREVRIRTNQGTFASPKEATRSQRHDIVDEVKRALYGDRLLITFVKQEGNSINPHRIYSVKYLGQDARTGAGRR